VSKAVEQRRAATADAAAGTFPRMNGRTLMALSIAVTLAACGGAQAQGSTTAPTATEADAETGATTETSGTTTAEAPEPESAPSDALARYGSDVMEMIRRHWAVPASIPASQVESLQARVEITVDESQFPTTYRIVEGSGNTLFDESVERALRDLVTAAERLPDPPAGLDDRGHVRLRLQGHRGP
jgi:outer membrane biosynthesis protein TonB